MGTRGHVGVWNPTDATITVRYVHSDATDNYLPYAIAGIWWQTFDRDTDATITALLAHDWDYLDPTTTAETTPFAGTPIAGVGSAINDLHDGPQTGRPSDLSLFGDRLFLFDRTRPGRLLCTSGRHITTATPTFDLSVGEHVRFASE